VLAIILSVPVVSKLFAFVLPTPTLMALGVGVALVSTLWFEGVKRVLARKVI
jgi:Ca2+-transporting ATPase